ncbi:MAG TPA: site-specific DNA-methyltransferase [Syntrophobacteraceae bacterium]|nr:site-specific DNA-methyltransferase [Syntrophobacteraceae bacterium]
MAEVEEKKPVRGGGGKVSAYKYPAKRKNIPPAGLEAHGLLEEAQRISYEYNPHLPPVLRSSPDAAKTDKLPDLIQKATERPLTSDEAKLLADALRRHEPWLEWSGKREKPWFSVEPVPLHIHERVSTQAILRVLARQDVQRHLFADPQQEYAKAVQFYKHDVDWSNRMILGDSLQVMASLARRENLMGKVQMIYIDPPYGIKFSSNFQPQLGQRDVKDTEKDLTREPEMVRAYRDTWTLGIHSYLAYLRDRLLTARELLASRGSIFVQIGDENIHRVRCLLDEVFRPENFVSLVTVKKTGGMGESQIDNISDYLLWYARDLASMKYNPIYLPKELGVGVGERFSRIELHTGEIRPLSAQESENVKSIPEGAVPLRGDPLTSETPSESTLFDFDLCGHLIQKPKKGGWKTNETGMQRLKEAERLLKTRDFVNFKKYIDDFAASSLGNLWADTMGTAEQDKIFVVQTTTKVVQRCLLMTTHPGDLVLDPTCGSGTTAYVAEQWGRRWITIDTSRVALALARQRLMTARYPFYKLRPVNAEDLRRNPSGPWLSEPNGKAEAKLTFECKTVPHITLKSIARNAALDSIFAKHEPILSARLQELNSALKTVPQEIRRKLLDKLNIKQKREGKKSITDADQRRWQLPKTDWKEWEVPFGTDPDWPKPLQDALVAYRKAWREKMDEVNECIAKNADTEELVDKPEISSAIVRVSGPFSMESVIALEENLDSPIGGEPEEDLETFGETGDIEAVNAEAHIEKIVRLLNASGVDFPGNLNVKFARLDLLLDSSLLHAEGEWTVPDQQDRRVAISIGPEVGNITTCQVEQAVRAANRRGYDDLVFAGFGFDASAQAAIEEATHPNLRTHMALITPDVQMGDLLKTQAKSQIFTVFSAPRVKLTQEGGQYVIEVEGMDIYDPVSNTISSTNRDRIAAWFLDSDYDERTFCICQAFFPDKSKWARLAKALGQQGVVNESAFEALSGNRSIPFPKGKCGCAAVKVIDPRGNEGLRIVRLP